MESNLNLNHSNNKKTQIPVKLHLNTILKEKLSTLLSTF